MAQPIDGLIPPGGWHYWQGDVKLDAYSLENLYKVVQDFRAENHLSIGDVHGAVATFLGIVMALIRLLSLASINRIGRTNC
jgi:hypothetical protein